MSRVLSTKILLLFLSLALLFTAARLVRGCNDPSWFVVAGSDFVDSSKTTHPFIVQPGQGYDGQFFYRFALNPFDFSKTAHGVTVDHPAYRMQRIGYPLLAWLLSFGGVPVLVPFALIILNILAFAGIAFYTGRLVRVLGGDVVQGLYPLLLCGLYMCMARDLAEVVELFFFTGVVYYLFTKRYLFCCLFAAFALLTRETSLIALTPLFAGIAYRVAKRELSAANVLHLFIPFALFGAWKLAIYHNIPSMADANAGYGSLGIPFKGMISGFRQNLDFSTANKVWQLLFWIMYMVWQAVFAGVVFNKVSFRGLRQLDNVSLLKIVYLLWLVFVICFADTIYCDDWGFLRIFSLWNMVGLLLIIAAGKKLGRAFIGFSAVLVLLTIIRLVIKV